MTRSREYQPLYEECLSRIAEYPKRSTYSDPIATIILGRFLLGPHFSTYQLHKALKEIPIKNMQRKRKIKKSYLVAYKDVHKRVKLLNSLGLIEESGIDKLPRNKITSRNQFDMKFASIHNPIYYRLTTGGIFNLVLYHVAETVEPPTAIFRYHGNNIIFRTFLYPFFKRSTLTRFRGTFLLNSVFTYLSKCCEVVDQTLATSNNNNMKVLIPLFNWNDIHGRNNETVTGRISDEFNINLLGGSRIKKINDKEIKISDQRNLIIIRLEDKYEATLIVNHKKVYTLGLEKSGDRLVVNKIATFGEDIALPLLNHHAKQNLLNLATSITMGTMVGRTRDEFIEFTAELDTEDLGILSKDQKVMNTLKEACKAHLNGYKAISKLERINSGILRDD